MPRTQPEFRWVCMKFINGKACPRHLCCFTDVVAEKTHPEASTAVTTVAEYHQHFLSRLPLPKSEVQLRAVMQIPQVLGRKLGVDGALCTADPSSTVRTTYDHVLLQPRVQVSPSIHISWYSPGEAAAPELPKSLLGS